MRNEIIFVKNFSCSSKEKKKRKPQHPFIESELAVLHYLGDKGGIKSLYKEFDIYIGKQEGILQ